MIHFTAPDRLLAQGLKADGHLLVGNVWLQINLLLRAHQECLQRLYWPYTIHAFASFGPSASSVSISPMIARIFRSFSTMLATSCSGGRCSSLAAVRGFFRSKLKPLSITCCTG